MISWGKVEKKSINGKSGTKCHRTHFLVLLVLDEVMHDTTVKYNQSVPEIVSSVSLPKENYKEKETIFSINLKFEI